MHVYMYIYRLSEHDFFLAMNVPGSIPKIKHMKNIVIPTCLLSFKLI